MITRSPQPFSPSSRPSNLLDIGEAIASPSSWNGHPYQPSSFHGKHVERGRTRTRRYPNLQRANNLETRPNMPHSGYRPRQSIPSDVSHHPRSYLSYLDDERDKEDELDPDLDEAVRAAGSRSRVKRKTVAPVQEDKTNVPMQKKIHAIDPACIRPIVRFDYSCLDDLDEELILRPRTAFAELCWSSAVMCPSRSKQRTFSDETYYPPHSFDPPSPITCEDSPLLQSSSTPPRLPTPPYSVYSHSQKETLNLPARPKVDVLSVSDDNSELDLDSGSETETEYEHSIRPMSNINQDEMTMDYSGMGGKASAEKTFVTSESISADPVNPPSPTYHYRQSHFATLHEQARTVPCPDDIFERKKSELDIGPFTFARDEDDKVPMISGLSHAQPTMIAYPSPQTAQFLNLQGYIGIAKPHESIGFFPMPTPEPKSTLKPRPFGTGISSKSGLGCVNNLGSSLSKFYRVTFSHSDKEPRRLD